MLGTRSSFAYRAISDILMSHMQVACWSVDDWQGDVHKLAELCELFDFGVFDMDEFPDIEDAMDFGLALRAVRPGFPTVFLSSDVKRCDYSRHRRAICDATLRLPVDTASLLLGVEAALLNAPKSGR
ncbi:MAG: hypothetical protein KGN33_13425 [Paracoccaceae bacterium]|nr:hypothetical protein [Paracoccaceae bacterium]